MAGQRHRHRPDQQRRGHRRQPALPAGRHAQGQGRLDPDAARVRDPGPLRLGDGQQERPGAARQVRRRQRRRDDRLGRPGVRPADRQAGLQLDRLAAHRAERFRDAVPPENGFPWDAYHVNSVDPLGNGTFLVSMRNTWARLSGQREDRARSSGRSAASTRRFNGPARGPLRVAARRADSGTRRRCRCSTTTAATSPAPAST